ncbi:MAG: hypothetical protein GY866_07680 [Proteobacteria bacterium]|nr:hypothetical protein [Pseudomonadota bacterium]
METEVPFVETDATTDIVTADVLLVKNRTLDEIASEYREGILFYEMLGSLSNLINALVQDLNIVGLENELTTRFVDNHPWLEEFRLSRRNIDTVGLKMALFVHESEDPKFVEDIIDVLSHQPSSLFPKSYIMKNLSLKETKKVSPLMLHEGSLKYFGLE